MLYVLHTVLQFTNSHCLLFQTTANARSQQQHWNQLNQLYYPTGPGHTWPPNYQRHPPRQEGGVAQPQYHGNILTLQIRIINGEQEVVPISECPLSEIGGSTVYYYCAFFFFIAVCINKSINDSFKVIRHLSALLIVHKFLAAKIVLAIPLSMCPYKVITNSIVTIVLVYICMTHIVNTGFETYVAAPWKRLVAEIIDTLLFLVLLKAYLPEADLRYYCVLYVLQ